MSIRSSAIQAAALEAAAAEVLSEKDIELFRAIMNIKRTLEGERVNLAHGLFGTSVMIDDGVLWTEQRHLWTHSVTVAASDYMQIDDSELKRHTFVLEPADLESIAQRMQRFHGTLGLFTGYISHAEEPTRAAQYRQLCAEPEIAQELSRLRAAGKSTPPTPRERSGKGRKR